MSAESVIRERVKAHLSSNHKVDGVQFIEEILVLASEVGEIRCSLAGEGKLRFQTPDEAAWDIELDRATTKVRMLCARLGVLCHESGDQDVSLYGGEGIIKKEVPPEIQNHRGSFLGSGLRSQATSLASPPTSKVWRVRFKNTPSEQEFTINAVRET